MKNTMKTLVVAALSLVLTTTSYAQCTKKTDDMTKEVSVETKLEKIGNSGTKGLTLALNIEARVVYSNSNYYVSLVPEFADIQTIEKDSKILIKLEDESLLTLLVDKTTISEHTSGKAFTQGTNTTIWYNSITADLSKEAVEKLKSKKVVKIRCQNTDYVIKGKGQDFFSTGLDCIDKTK